MIQMEHKIQSALKEFTSETDSYNSTETVNNSIHFGTLKSHLNKSNKMEQNPLKKESAEENVREIDKNFNKKVNILKPSNQSKIVETKNLTENIFDNQEQSDSSLKSMDKTNQSENTGTVKNSNDQTKNTKNTITRNPKPKVKTTKQIGHSQWWAIYDPNSTENIFYYYNSDNQNTCWNLPNEIQIKLAEDIKYTKYELANSSTEMIGLNSNQRTQGDAEKKHVPNKSNSMEIENQPEDNRDPTIKQEKPNDEKRHELTTNQSKENRTKRNRQIGKFEWWEINDSNSEYLYFFNAHNSKTSWTLPYDVYRFYKKMTPSTKKTIKKVPIHPQRNQGAIEGNQTNGSNKNLQRGLKATWNLNRQKNYELKSKNDKNVLNIEERSKHFVAARQIKNSNWFEVYDPKLRFMFYLDYNTKNMRINEPTSMEMGSLNVSNSEMEWLQSKSKENGILNIPRELMLPLESKNTSQNYQNPMNSQRSQLYPEKRKEPSQIMAKHPQGMKKRYREDLKLSNPELSSQLQSSNDSSHSLPSAKRQLSHLDKIRIPMNSVEFEKHVQSGRNPKNLIRNSPTLYQNGGGFSKIMHPQEYSFHSRMSSPFNSPLSIGAEMKNVHKASRSPSSNRNGLMDHYRQMNRSSSYGIIPSNNSKIQQMRPSNNVPFDPRGLNHSTPSLRALPNQNLNMPSNWRPNPNNSHRRLSKTMQVDKILHELQGNNFMQSHLDNDIKAIRRYIEKAEFEYSRKKPKEGSPEQISSDSQNLKSDVNYKDVKSLIYLKKMMQITVECMNQKRSLQEQVQTILPRYLQLVKSGDNRGRFQTDSIPKDLNSKPISNDEKACAILSRVSGMDRGSLLEAVSTSDLRQLLRMKTLFATAEALKIIEKFTSSSSNETGWVDEEKEDKMTHPTHMVEMSTNRKMPLPYVCFICACRFINERKLDAHFVENHCKPTGTKMICSRCSEEFLSGCAFKTHTGTCRQSTSKVNWTEKSTENTEGATKRRVFEEQVGSLVDDSHPKVIKIEDESMSKQSITNKKSVIQNK